MCNPPLHLGRKADARRIVWLFYRQSVTEISQELGMYVINIYKLR